LGVVAVSGSGVWRASGLKASGCWEPKTGDDVGRENAACVEVSSWRRRARCDESNDENSDDSQPMSCGVECAIAGQHFLVGDDERREVLGRLEIT
jgi:hypothetical protein